MGCVNSTTEALISQQDLQYIVRHTNISQDEIVERFENFVARHPDGKVTRLNFRHVAHGQLTFLKANCLSKIFKNSNC